MRILNKGLNGVAPKPVSGYVSGITTYIEGDTGADTTNFNVISSLTLNTWESVGPTGSGADNIWTALDSVLDNATYVILRARIYVYHTSTVASARLHARKTGSSATASIFGVTHVAEAFAGATNATAVDARTVTEFKVPIDSSGRFDLYWDYTTAYTTITIDTYLVGFGI